MNLEAILAAHGVKTLEELLAELRSTYTPPPIPRCRICDGALSIQQVGGGMPTVWACSGREDDPDRPGYVRSKEGRWEKSDPSAPSEFDAKGHYSASRWTDYRQGGDTRVLALIDLFEQATGRAGAQANQEVSQCP